MLVCVFFLLCVFCSSYVGSFYFLSSLVLGNSSDWVSIWTAGSVQYSYFLMLFICGSIALWYSCHYFGWHTGYLNVTISLFLLVMLALSFSSDFLSSLIFWEFLGVVSYFLIIYYNNYSTLYSANATLVSSRFGDAGFFLIIGFFSFYFNSSYLLLLLLLVITTKSAILPFSSWLLEAMRAPTPVSSLVHSSTLVAAGVWFSLNYSLALNNYTIDILIILCLITIFISSISAIWHYDLKKLIALSTCNNVSWCLLFYFCGDVNICLVQLISHGVGKCLLFMCIGDKLASSHGNQYIGNISSGNCILSGNLYFTVFLTLTLSGFVSTGVYFSKHLLAGGLFSNFNFLLTTSIFFCIMLSYIYSGRLLAVLLGLNENSINNSVVNVFYPVSAVLILNSFINFYFVYNIEESSAVSFIMSCVLFSYSFLGILVGMYLGFYNSMAGVFSVSFFLQDLSLKSVNYLFSLLSSLACIFVSFRWEVSLYNCFYNAANTTGFSLNRVLVACIFVNFFLALLLI